jgi:hypothetical protein
VAEAILALVASGDAQADLVPAAYGGEPSVGARWSVSLRLRSTAWQESGLWCGGTRTTGS